MILDALTLSERDPAVRKLVDTFGGDMAAATERAIGEPAYLSRRLTFRSGAEIILHDDSVAAVVLHLTQTATRSSALDLSDWMFDLGNDATLGDLQDAVGTAPRFASFGIP